MEQKNYDMFNEESNRPVKFGDSKLFQVADDHTCGFQSVSELDQRLFGYTRINNQE